jgi:hypothetical protein
MVSFTYKRRKDFNLNLKQMNHPTKLLFLIYCLIVIGIASLVYCVASTKKVQQIVPKQAKSVILGDSITLYSKLYWNLQEREGFSPVRYSDHKGHEFCGYGHLLLKKDKFVFPITRKFADSLLLQDIEKAKVECKRLKAEVSYWNLKRIFISGHL